MIITIKERSENFSFYWRCFRRSFLAFQNSSRFPNGVPFDKDFLFLKILENISSFCEATDIPVLDFW